MPKLISFTEAKKRFNVQGRTDIEICEDGFVGWTSKSKFYDFIENDYFWSTPKSVFVQHCCHPNRGKNNKKTKLTSSYEEINKRFILQGRDDIFLLKENYVGWTKKSKFYDLLEQDYFWAITRQVYEQKIVHPNRRKNKKNNTNLNKFGVKNVFESKEIKQKIKDTNILRYGVENVFSSPIIIKQLRATNIIKYGFEYPLQNKHIKEKREKTCLLIYGERNVLSTNIVKNKIKETFYKKYGVHPTRLLSVKQKTKETNILKYGVDSFLKTNLYKMSISNRFIIETGEHVRTWWLRNTNIDYKILLKNFPNKNIPIKELENFLINLKLHKSYLEILTEKLLNIIHYNKYIIGQNYRPDFKISDTIYVNVDGLYWHSEKHKDYDYHYNMRKLYEENNLLILQFRENDIKNKSIVVKSIVNSYINIFQTKIASKDCKMLHVKENEAEQFLYLNNLKYSIKSKYIGLYYNSELVYVLSYNIIGSSLEIKNFCSKCFYNVIDGFTKLIQFLEIENDISEICYWADLRYELCNNELLLNNFNKIEEIDNWEWTDGRNTYDKTFCINNMDKRKLSSTEYANELGLYKIYDAGQRLYIKTIKTK